MYTVLINETFYRERPDELEGVLDLLLHVLVQWASGYNLKLRAFVFRDFGVVNKEVGTECAV